MYVFFNSIKLIKKNCIGFEGSEVAVLETIPWQKVDIQVISVKTYKGTKISLQKKVPLRIFRIGLVIFSKKDFEL